MKYLIVNIKRLKKIFLNFSFKGSTDLLGRALGLLTFPIITRALGPEGYGSFTLISVIMQFTLIPVTLLGLRPYGIREIAKGKNIVTKIVNDILSSQISVIVSIIPISIALVIFFFNSQVLFLKSVFIGYIFVIANVFNIDFFFIARKNLVIPAISSLIGQVIMVVGVILFIKQVSDLPILILLSGISPSVAAIILIIKYLKSRNNISIRFSLRNAIVLFKNTYKLGLSTNLELFYPSIPLILLPILLNNYFLGIYSAGYKVFAILVLFYVAFFYALAPYFVQLKEFESKRKAKYIFLLFGLVTIGGLIIGLLLFLFGEQLLNLLLGKSFGESVSVFKAISLTLIPFWPVLMLAGNIFIYFGTEKYYLLSISVATIVAAVSTPFFIIEYSVFGAVYSMAISLFAAILMSGYFIIKIEPEILSTVKYYLLRKE